MIRIKSEHVKAFLSQTGTIKPNILYPALDCIKVSTGGKKLRLQRSNMNVHCQNTYDQDDLGDQGKQQVLVNIAALNAFVTLFNESVINIEVKDGQVILTAGKKERQCLPWEDPVAFPALPLFPEQAGTVLTPADIGFIKIAGKYVSDDGQRGPLWFVHLGAAGIFACCGSYIYHHTTKSELPEVLIDDNTISILATMAEGGASMRASEKYIFIEAGRLVYAVLREEFKTFPYMHHLSKKVEDVFTINRGDLVKFCSLVEACAKQDWPIGYLEQSGDHAINLAYIDADFHRDANDEVQLMRNSYQIPRFAISIRRLNAALKALPYETLNFHPIENHLKITTDEDAAYSGMVSGMGPQ